MFYPRGDRRGSDGNVEGSYRKLPQQFASSRGAVSGRKAGQEGLCLSYGSAGATRRVTRLPTVDATRLIRALKRAGFVNGDHRGSHLTLWNPKTKCQTTVPVHARDIKRGLMKQILKQANISETDFQKLI